MYRCHSLAVQLIAITISIGLPKAEALESVTWQREGQSMITRGQVLVEAQDGGLLLVDPDGVLWMIQPNEITSRTATDEPFAPTTRRDFVKRLQDELPSQFRIRETAHYLFAYDTSTAYAKWCGVLYERLYRAFYNFWRQRGLELEEPEFPLLATIFARRSDFAAYSTAELGDAVRSVVGYYSLETNRVVMYDLTGLEHHGGEPTSDMKRIQQLLSRPAAVPNVATIVHEATHQLAYNSGLQTRYADNPLWLSEGLAMFFETPDFRSDKGWRRVGGVHPIRLGQFRASLDAGSPRRLEQLLVHDEVFRDPETAGPAYAEAWSLSYYLLRRQPDRFIEYLREIAAEQPLINRTAAERVAMFRRHFGDLTVLDEDFVRYMIKLK